MHIKQIGGSRFQSVLFNIIVTAFKNYNTAPDEALVRVEIDNICNQFGSEGNGLIYELKTDLNEFIIFSKVVEASSEKLARDLIEFITDTCVFQPAVTDLLQTAVSEKKLDGLGKKIVELERQQSGVAGAHLVQTGVNTVMAEDGERVPTGIPWIDARFGNGQGLPLGAGVAIIAPQRCGKTTLGVSLSINQALQGKHTLLVLAEQGMDKAVQRKIRAAALGCSYDLLAKNKDDIDAVIKEANIDPDVAKRRLEAIENHLHYLDMIQNPGGVGTIVTQIEGMISSGRKPTYVYVDWAGKLADMIMGGGFDDQQFTKKYDALKFLASELTAVGARHNLIMCISHQMAADSIKKGPFTDNGTYCAADCRSFTELFRYVFVINERDSKTKLQLFQVPKAREDDPPMPFCVKLRGDYCDFQDFSQTFEMKGKRFIDKSGKKPKGLPTEF